MYALRNSAGALSRFSSETFIVIVNTDIRRLTTGIRSDKCTVGSFRRCAKMYLHKRG